MPKLSQVAKRFRAGNVIAGIEEHLPRGEALVVSGKRYTPEELVAIFGAHIDALDAVRSARVAFARAVEEERKAGRRVVRLLAKFQIAMMNRFGPDGPSLFGFPKPKKPGPKTAAAKAAGAAKARATRAARKTMGRRQRQKVRG